MYLKTKDYKYYDNFIKTVSETNLINKFNLDLDSFFIKFENKYFLHKINESIKYNLDIESILIEIDGKLINE